MRLEHIRAQAPISCWGCLGVFRLSRLRSSCYHQIKQVKGDIATTSPWPRWWIFRGIHSLWEHTGSCQWCDWGSTRAYSNFPCSLTVNRLAITSFINRNKEDARFRGGRRTPERCKLSQRIRFRWKHFMPFYLINKHHILIYSIAVALFQVPDLLQSSSILYEDWN